MRKFWCELATLRLAAHGAHFPPNSIAPTSIAMQFAMHVINKPFQKNTFRYAKGINTTNIYNVDGAKY
jgi:hypothetical protein